MSISMPNIAHELHMSLRDRSGSVESAKSRCRLHGKVRFATDRIRILESKDIETYKVVVDSAL